MQSQTSSQTSSSPSQTSSQSPSAPTALPRNGARWTETETLRLREQVKDGLKRSDIANLHLRSTRGIEYKLVEQAARYLCERGSDRVAALKKFAITPYELTCADRMRVHWAASAIRGGSKTATADFNLLADELTAVNRINANHTVTNLQKALGVQDRKLIVRLFKIIGDVAAASTIDDTQTLLEKIQASGYRPY